MKHADSLIHGDVTHQIIGAFFDVYHEMGYGFLERVYRRSMAIALRERGVHCIEEAPHTAQFRGIDVGYYRTDLLVEDKVIVEIKTAVEMSHPHDAQLYNYLKASRMRVGLLLNFGPKPTYARHILTPNYQRPDKTKENSIS